MFKNLKNKKKKGFTLVELIAVIAIIGILAAVLVPTISGYLTKAKKAKVVEQARQYVMACEAVKAEGTAIADGVTPGTITGTAKTKVEEIIPMSKIPLVQNITLGNATSIVNGDSDFEINADGEFSGMKATT